jgi:hypothetical protein
MTLGYRCGVNCNDVLAEISMSKRFGLKTIYFSSSRNRNMSYNIGTVIPIEFEGIRNSIDVASCASIS